MTAAEASELFAKNGFPLDVSRVDMLLGYERLLLDWNTKINLVSRRETSGLFLRQIVGSISFLFSHHLAAGSTVLDVGTGGGLPGIPLAVVRPDLGITIVDSIRKKITAVSAIIAGLGLGNIRAICGRVEELDPEIVGTFDYIVARGVSSASEVVGWCAPLLGAHAAGPRAGAPGPGAPGGPAVPGGRASRSTAVPRGSYILLKGGDLAGELESLSETAGGASITVRSLTVEGAEDSFTEKKIIVVTP